MSNRHTPYISIGNLSYCTGKRPALPRILGVLGPYGLRPPKVTFPKLTCQPEVLGRGITDTFTFKLIQKLYTSHTLSKRCGGFPSPRPCPCPSTPWGGPAWPCAHFQRTKRLLPKNVEKPKSVDSNF